MSDPLPTLTEAYQQGRDDEAIGALTTEDLTDAYSAGVRDSMLRATQYERILTNLIAELRGRHADCTTCYTKRALDRAEARLEEVQGE